MLQEGLMNLIYNIFRDCTLNIKLPQFLFSAFVISEGDNHSFFYYFISMQSGKLIVPLYASSVQIGWIPNLVPDVCKPTQLYV